MKTITKQHCEFLRQQAKEKFNKVRGTWCDLLQWGMPHLSTWILSQNPGERKNFHIVDPTHILALRSCVAGFSEGNTSTTRPWARIDTRDSDKNDNEGNKAWLQHYTQRVMSQIRNSNFYNAAGGFYYQYHTVNTGAHYFEEMENGVHVHTLIPGSYFPINNSRGVAVILVREFCLNVKALVDTYGVKNKDGKVKWDNFSYGVKKMYDDGHYTQQIEVCHIIMENPEWDIRNPDAPFNRRWLELTYEVGAGGRNGNTYGDGNAFELLATDKDQDVFLKRFTTKRKPFVVGKSTDEFEYGEKGPMLDSLGLIKSLNKKAIGKDQALEQILNPALQGPASLRKSYVSSAPNTYVPLDSRSVSGKQKVESIYQINPAIQYLIQDTGDLRNQVDKLFYADFLMFLSRNPKTRTAAETNAIVDEQQRVVGPSLQSLNTTYNIPVLEYFMDYTLFEDPYLDPPPEALAGQSLNPELVSIFAQAQKAADLPAIERYMAMVTNVGQVNPKIWEKANLDKLADLYEDRLYLPTGLNNPQSKVDAMREQAQRQMQQQQMLQETIPAVAGAAKDLAAARPRE